MMWKSTPFHPGSFNKGFQCPTSGNQGATIMTAFGLIIPLRTENKATLAPAEKPR
jgi:hypothetical protein